MALEHTLGLTLHAEDKFKKSKPGTVDAPVTRQSPKEGTYVPPPYPTVASSPLKPDNDATG